MAGVQMLARVELRRAWRVMVTLGLLAGLGAGTALASVQLARRASTAFERLERASGTPDAMVMWIADRTSSPVPDVAGVRRSWDATWSVGRVRADSLLFLGVVAGTEPPPEAFANPLVVEGRALDPDADDELVVTQYLADAAGFRVGDELAMAFLTADEVAQFDSGFGEPDGPRIRMRVVGVVRSAVGQGDNAPGAFSTAAFARRLAAAGATYPATFVDLTDGTAGIGRFEQRLDALGAAAAPVAGGEEFAPYLLTAPSAQRPVIAVTTRVLVTGLLVFGGVAGIAALLAVALALRRQLLLLPATEARALAAVGVTRRQVWFARWLAALPFTMAGTVTAAALVVAGGFVEPIGSLGQLEPHPGFHVNVAVVAIGTVIVLLLLAGVAASAGVRVGGAPDAGAVGTSRLVDGLGAMGAPPPVVIGTGLAVEPGRGRATVAVRSALVATALAVAGLVAVMVFASSLDRLSATPGRWGWSRTDAFVLDANDQLVERLRADTAIAALATVDDFTVRVEGRNVTGGVYRGARGPTWTVLDGRAPRAAGEVMLGARLARSLGRTMGDRVVFRDASGERVSLAVVGVGTGPQRTDGVFGGGLLVGAEDAARLALTQPQRSAAIAFAPDVDAARAAAALSADMELSTPVAPPDVANLSQLGRLPELLAAFLALLAVAVLAHSMATTAQRRRRELDTLRAVGFVRSEIRVVLVVASIVTVMIGLAIGIPVGLLLGGAAWRFTAHSAYVSGDLAVSVARLVAFVVVAVLVGVAVALLPAWRVTRGSVADGLRAE